MHMRCNRSWLSFAMMCRVGPHQSQSAKPSLYYTWYIHKYTRGTNIFQAETTESSIFPHMTLNKLLRTVQAPQPKQNTLQSTTAMTPHLTYSGPAPSQEKAPQETRTGICREMINSVLAVALKLVWNTPFLK